MCEFVIGDVVSLILPTRIGPTLNTKDTIIRCYTPSVTTFVVELVADDSSYSQHTAMLHARSYRHEKPPVPRTFCRCLRNGRQFREGRGRGFVE